jgi:hypothetical protein
MRSFAIAQDDTCLWHVIYDRYVLEYFDIFSKIPIEHSKNISDEPPALIKGSALPVGGIDDVATAM